METKIEKQVTLKLTEEQFDLLEAALFEATIHLRNAGMHDEAKDVRALKREILLQWGENINQ